MNSHRFANPRPEPLEELAVGRHLMFAVRFQHIAGLGIAGPEPSSRSRRGSGSCRSLPRSPPRDCNPAFRGPSVPTRGTAGPSRARSSRRVRRCRRSRPRLPRPRTARWPTTGTCRWPKSRSWKTSGPTASGATWNRTRSCAKDACSPCEPIEILCDIIGHRCRVGESLGIEVAVLRPIGKVPGHEESQLSPPGRRQVAAACPTPPIRGFCNDSSACVRGLGRLFAKQSVERDFPRAVKVGKILRPLCRASAKAMLPKSGSFS